MEVLYSRCCGLDVHKASVTACVLLREQGRTRKLHRRFTTMTEDLRNLAEWLSQLQVTHVAIESTGVYWKPVWNVLEGQFTIILANPQHVKNVPGRKTDAKDGEWIAELAQHGLLRSSYVPPVIIRDLRDLTRARACLSQEASRIGSRIQKVLEDANLKLSSVASNTLGKSGRAMLDAIVSEDEERRGLREQSVPSSARQQASKKILPMPRRSTSIIAMYATIGFIPITRNGEAHRRQSRTSTIQ
ncbi:MAG: IS110 family transposase [Bryobacteraceae bacterium]|jgi:transposase